MLKKLDLKDYYDLHAYLILNALKAVNHNKDIKFSEVQYYQYKDREYLYYNNKLLELDWDEGVYSLNDPAYDDEIYDDYYDDELGTWNLK